MIAQSNPTEFIQLVFLIFGGIIGIGILCFLGDYISNRQDRLDAAQKRRHAEELHKARLLQISMGYIDEQLNDRVKPKPKKVESVK